MSSRYSSKRNYVRNKMSMRSASKSVEVKSVDIACVNSTFGVTNNDPATGGFVFLLNALAQGPASYQRVGITINSKSIRLRGSIAPIAFSTFPGPYVRVALVYDVSPQNGIASYTDIFQGIDSTGGTINSGSVSPNPSNKSRFYVLRDDQFQLGYVANSGSIVYSTSPAQVGEDKFVKVWDRRKNGPLAVQYNNIVENPAPTIAGINTGAFYLVIYNSAATATLGANFTVRFSYTDQ